MHVTLVTGYRGTGKDTYYRHLSGLDDKYKYVTFKLTGAVIPCLAQRIGFADKLKESIRAQFNLAADFDDKSAMMTSGKTFRQECIDLAQNMRLKDKAHWAKLATVNLKQDSNYVVTDWRYPDELDYISTLTTSVTTVRLFRKEVVVMHDPSENSNDALITDYIVIPAEDWQNHLQTFLEIFPQYNPMLQHHLVDIQSCIIPTIPVLDDGFVRLVDMMPRMVSVDRNLEAAIVRNARVSFGTGLKSEQEDIRLIRYLYLNKHSSPFESVIFTFHLRLPRFVATHFHRHRTASINEFSQRYAEINDDSFYRPTTVANGVRGVDPINKQSSVIMTECKAQETMLAMEAASEFMFQLYHKALDSGVAKECAREQLPLSTYTEMYFTISLHNLLHLLRLRYDEHTQKETRDYAEAIYKLIKPLVPTVMELFDDEREGIFLSGSELRALREGSLAKTASVSERRTFEKKLALLKQYLVD